MKLGDWIKDRKMTLEAFGHVVSADKSTVSRWVDGTVVPRPSKMREITEATGGEVTANDFMAVVPADGIQPTSTGPRAA